MNFSHRFFKRSFHLVFILAVFLVGCNSHPRIDQYDTQQFDQDMERYYDLLKVPGIAIGVANEDQLVYFRGFGYANKNQATPITEDHIFWIASLTKTFSAISLKRWEEEGIISLKDSIRSYPNKYFNPDRLEPGMTIEHVISHTSESNPKGELFVYNGGRYNIIFNVFDEVSPVEDSTDVIRPFTQTIDEQILTPLELNHTFTRSQGERYDSLKHLLVTPYSFRSDSGAFIENHEVINFKTSFPSTGMLSSVSDLVSYSHAIDEGQIISRESYEQLTKPYYENSNGSSPYGLGWFTTNFEGISMHWGYGYGAADASIILKVPSRKLTLVMLSNAAMPSGAIRLGNGNPLNSAVIISFLKHFVFNNTFSTPGIDFRGDLDEIKPYLQTAMERTDSNLYLEEAYAYAMMMQYLPPEIAEDSDHAARLLLLIDDLNPEFFNPTRIDAFELLASFDNPEIAPLSSKLVTQYEKEGHYHPLKSFYTASIYEKMDDIDKATRFYEQLADTDAFNEQPVTYEACIWLGKHYITSDTLRARRYLEKVLKNKELVGQLDDTYNEAKTLLIDLP